MATVSTLTQPLMATTEFHLEAATEGVATTGFGNFVDSQGSITEFADSQGLIHRYGPEHVEAVVKIQRCWRKRIYRERGLSGILSKQEAKTLSFMLDIDVIQKKEMAKPFWKVVVQREATMEEVQALTFAAKAFEEKFDKIEDRSTLQKMYKLAAFSESFATDPKTMKILRMLAIEFIEQRGLTPLPQRHDVVEYMSILEDVMTNQVPQEVLSKLGRDTMTVRAWGYAHEKQPWKDDIRDAVLDSVVKTLEQRTKRLLRKPLLRWFHEVLTFSMGTKRRVGPTCWYWKGHANDFQKYDGHVGPTRVFAVLQLSDVLVQLVRATDMVDADVEMGGALQQKAANATDNKGVPQAIEFICLTAIQEFRLHVDRLIGIKNAQIARANKILATTVGALIAGGQVFGPLVAKWTVQQYFPDALPMAADGPVAWHV